MSLVSIARIASAREDGTASDSMSATVLILVIACIAPGAALVVVFWRLGSAAPTLPLTTVWIDEFSVERYRPMLRVLDGTDPRFLCPHSSVRPNFVAHFRREQCRILRGYLRSLTMDFTRVLTALKLVMAQASIDRPDLASLLIRSQATFAVCIVMAQVQLMLYRIGIGTVNIGELLKVFEGMRLELRTLIPRTLGSAT